MTNYGIKITKDGYGITSAEPRNYVLSSTYSAVKIALAGSGTINVSAASTATATIAHGLSFIPAVLFFSELSPGSGKYFSGCTHLSTPDADAGDVGIYAGTDADRNPVESWVDATNLKIAYHNFHASQSRIVTYYYYFFGDSGV